MVESVTLHVHGFVQLVSASSLVTLPAATVSPGPVVQPSSEEENEMVTHAPKNGSRKDGLPWRNSISYFSEDYVSLINSLPIAPLSLGLLLQNRCQERQAGLSTHQITEEQTLNVIGEAEHLPLHNGSSNG